MVDGEGDLERDRLLGRYQGSVFGGLHDHVRAADSACRKVVVKTLWILRWRRSTYYSKRPRHNPCDRPTSLPRNAL